MIVLAELERDEYCGAPAIARRIGAPRNYLGKLLQQLSRHRLVESQKGLGGGFRLSRPSQQITMYDIAESIENLDRWTTCILGNNECDGNNPCTIHDRWGAVREAYLDMLKNTRISDITPAALERGIDSGESL